jgi:phosphonate transport system substrate-binding protein
VQLGWKEESMLRCVGLVLITVVATLALVACQAGTSPASTVAPSPTQALSPAQILVLADVSDDPAHTIEAFQPLADYLAERLAEQGIRQGRVVVAPDLTTMMDDLKSGEVDLYFDSPYPALAVYEETGAQPLLRRWKGGVKEYHTVIVARRGSGIQDLDGLQGKIVAFDDQVSTSGYLLPKAFLVKSGYQAVEVADAASQVGPDEIGYLFAGGEENVLAWVLEGKTGGAAIPSDKLEALEAGVQEQLVALAQTPAVPRHIALASPGMDEAVKTRLVELLLTLHETPEGLAILATFEETSRFDLLPQGPEGTMAALQQLFAPVR